MTFMDIAEARRDLRNMTENGVRELAAYLWMDFMNRHAADRETLNKVMTIMRGARSGEPKITVGSTGSLSDLSEQDIQAIVRKVQEALLKQARRSRRPGLGPNGS